MAFEAETTKPPTANRARLKEDFETLAAIGRQPGGGLLREAYSPSFLEARSFVRGRMEAAGLSTRVDAVGNLFGRTQVPSGGPAVLTGSHLDAVRNGGVFDGAAGVIAGLEAARTIVEVGIPLTRAIEVVGFVDEEGRFSGLLGSAVMTGLASHDRLLALHDEEGISLSEALTGAGHDPARLMDASRSPTEISSFVELHVEQGATLSQAGVPIGVVTAIAGTHRLSVELNGRADHAGSTPMEAREDALLAAAEIILATRRIVQEADRPTARGTVGWLLVEPNVTSAVAERVRLVVDLRDVDAAARQAVAERVTQAIADACAREGVRYNVTNPMSATPCATSAHVSTAIESACSQLGVRYMHLMSGASHDAQNVAQITATGMIFVPSFEGRSHSPAELTDFEDLAQGTDVLIATLLMLAR